MSPSPMYLKCGSGKYKYKNTPKQKAADVVDRVWVLSRSCASIARVQLQTNSRRVRKGVYFHGPKAARGLPSHLVVQ